MTSNERDHFSVILESYESDINHCHMTDINLAAFDSHSLSYTTVSIHQALLLPHCPRLARLVGDHGATSDPTTIILANTTLPVLQGLLTIVYTGKCFLNNECTVNDILMLIQNIGMSVSNLEQVMLKETECQTGSCPKNRNEGVRGIKILTTNTDQRNESFHCSTETPLSAKDYKCQNCEKKLPSPLHLIHHMQVTHDLAESFERFKCKFCYKTTYGRSDTLLEHMQTVHVVYTCNRCSKTFHGRGNSKDNQLHNPFSRYNQHNEEKHEGKGSFSFHLRKNFLKKDIQEPKHKCNKCNMSFSVLADMYFHVVTEHNGLKCIFCQYSVTKKKGKYQDQTLLEHLMIHTGEKNHMCKFCGKKFTARKTWANHEKMHTGEKNYQCIHCDAKFVQMGSLTYHLKKHKNGDSFVDLSTPGHGGSVSVSNMNTADVMKHALVQKSPEIHKFEDIPLFNNNCPPKLPIVVKRVTRRSTANQSDI